MNKSQLGKKSRKKGKDFEVAVRKDLIANGWLVTRFDNQVDLENNCLSQSKAKFNPFTRRVMTMSSGFPDFLCVKFEKIPPYVYTLDVDYNKEQIERLQREIKKCNDKSQIITSPNVHINQLTTTKIQLLECKINGKLDKLEREKVDWLKNNLKIPVFVAYKDENNKITYKEV